MSNTDTRLASPLAYLEVVKARVEAASQHLAPAAPYDIHADFARIKARHEHFEAEFSTRPQVDTDTRLASQLTYLEVAKARVEAASALPGNAYDIHADFARIKARHEQTEAKLAAVQLQAA